MAKKPGTSVANYDKEFAAQAVEASKGFEAPTGKFISLKGGKMSFGGANIPGNEFTALVLGAVYENQFYDPDVPYDPETPQVPICFAFGRETACADVGPHENSTQPQNETCAGCEHNEFGSAERGKGKACKNVLRLALITEDELDEFEKADLTYLKVPVMSVRNWGSYVNDAKKVHGRPYYAMTVNISLEEDNKSQFRVVFDAREKVNLDPKRLLARHEAVMKDIDFPYQVVEREPPPKKGSKKVEKKQKFAAR